MSLYEGAKTRVKIIAVTQFAIKGVLSELLYADDIVLMSATIKRLGISSENGRRLKRARI